MHPKRRRKLVTLISMLVALALATACVLYALRQNLNLYYTPSQAVAAHAPIDRSMRIGGMVKQGSIHHGQGLLVSFKITDFKADMPVDYRGVLPALFRSGQGVVVQGRLDKQGRLHATQVLAKHDEKYRPPGMRRKTHAT